tara:strand:- start:1974 stop:2201 length:228 start_codon:yes stop_codon:yes gene_type:complete
MIKDITAYNIDGEYYLHEGKPNGNTKKKIKRRIQKNQEAKKRGEAQTPIHSYSFIDGWEEAQKTNPSEKRTKNKN